MQRKETSFFDVRTEQWLKLVHNVFVNYR